MKKLVIMGILAVFVLSIAASAIAAAGSAPPTSFAAAAKVGDKATCIVTKQAITIAKNSPFSKINNKYYYFATQAAKLKFDQNPQTYINPPVK